MGKTNGISSTDEISESKYSHFLCFTVSVRTNRFVSRNLDRYTPEQQELHDLIKSLHDGGWSYKKITKHLNDKGIPTPTGKRWGDTGNSVYSVLKRHRERVKNLETVEKDYEPEWSKMEVRWEKNCV